MISARTRLSAIASGILMIASPVAAAPVLTPQITPKPAGPLPAPYPNTAAALQVQAGSPAIEVQSFSWGAAADQAPPVATSDPQEGGEVARAKPKVSDMPVVKVQDKSSATLSRSAPVNGENVQSAMPQYEVASPRDAASGLPTGKRMHKPFLALADPLPAGTVTIVVARGSCVKGQHIKEGILTTRQASYDLKELEVLGCTAVSDSQDSCTLTYAALR